MNLLDEAVGLNLVKEAVMNLLLKKIKFHERSCGTGSPERGFGIEYLLKETVLLQEAVGLNVMKELIVNLV